MNSNELNIILKQNPTLTLFGYQDNLDSSLGHYDNIDINKNPLTAEWIPNIEKCIEWLQNQQFITRYYQERTSQKLKVPVERESKMYIPAGCLIVACHHLQIPVKRKLGTPDVLIPVSIRRK